MDRRPCVWSRWVRRTVARRVARDRGIVAHVVQAVAADSGLTINRDEFGDDHRVVEGTTAAETTIVYVAAFDDGWNFYVECGLSLGVRGDDRLIDEIVEVCRATVPVGE